MPEHPKTTHFPIAPRQANITWCLQCGVKGSHAIVHYQKDNRAVIFPTREDKSELEAICTWCAIRGHQFANCMRRVPQQADANKIAIDQLSLRVDALSKSVDKVNALDVEVSGLRTDVQSLMS